MLAAVLAAAALTTGFLLGLPFLFSLLFYLFMTFAYSAILKNIFIVDVIVVATGFVIRAIAGAVAIHVVFSNWLIVWPFFLRFFGTWKTPGGDCPSEKEAATIGKCCIITVSPLLTKCL